MRAAVFGFWSRIFRGRVLDAAVLFLCFRKWPYLDVRVELAANAPCYCCPHRSSVMTFGGLTTSCKGVDLTREALSSSHFVPGLHAHRCSCYEAQLCSVHTDLQTNLHLVSTRRVNTARAHIASQHNNKDDVSITRASQRRLAQF